MPTTTIRAQGPFVGINKALDQSLLTTAEASDALNLNLDKGTLRKRAGYTQRTQLAGGAITGILDWLRVDGSVLSLFKAGPKLYKRSGSTNTELASGLSTTELASFAVANDRAYFTESTALKVTDGTTVYSAQITRPSAAPAVATSGSVGAGKLDGDYSYKWTYYSSTWGQESPASDASVTVSPDKQNVSVTGLSASVDARVDKIRIYRRKISAAETLWFLVDTIAGSSTSYTDSKLDNDISAIDFAPLSFTDALPAFRYLAFQAEIMFLAGSDTYPTRLYFTESGKPWYVVNFITVGSDGDNESITGIYPFQSIVVVFKERSIWLLSGNSKETFYARKVIPDVGCRSHHSVVNVDNVLYFLSEEGFYAFDGNQVEEISKEAKPDLVPRNFSRDKYVVGVHDFENNAVIWSYSAAGSSTSNKLYAWFYSNSRGVQRTKRSESEAVRSWCPWDMAQVTALSLLTDPTTRRKTVAYGFSTGVIGDAGSDSDAGGNITYRWTSGKIDLGLQELSKRWGTVTLEATKRASASNLGVWFYLDGDTNPTQIGANVPQTAAIARRRLRRRSRSLRLEFSQVSTTPTELLSWTLETELAGRA